MGDTDMDFAQALANAVYDAAQDDGGKDDAPAPLPEAAIADLRELCSRYTAGCPFRVGDLVTPRGGYNLRGPGDPHIVVEVADVPVRNLDNSADSSGWASCAFGARLDIRVAHIQNGKMTMHWSESWMYEPYTGPAS
jgi:hypothetical protein